MKRYISGAKKRHIADEKKAFVSKLPKISSFLKSDKEDVASTSAAISEIQDSELPIENDFNKGTSECVNADRNDKRKEPSGLQTISSNKNTESTSTSSQANKCHESLSTDTAHPTVSTDPALWHIDENLISYCAQKGPTFCRNKDSNFKKSSRIYE
ncbi:uncharacterized protein LOC116417040 [Nasonia vitripennis]|uniref:Uncharacterized protein n=1 Tax=Nasonia vitripennis TaxID=7425 RepID=A0A7M7QCJ7_NASVI|nr:uncharacterized protein LOC116417039 [Nasonia vitripennis]XP_031783960.1 uncharacterized protein LOC116417040 [Nasonia vitripennis]